MKSRLLLALAAAPLCTSAAFAADPAILADVGAAVECKTFPAEPATILDKHRHPMEIELVYGVGLDVLDAKLKKDLDGPNTPLAKKRIAAIAEAKKAKPNAAVIDAYFAALLPRLRASAQAQAAMAQTPNGQKLRMPAARQDLCRMASLGKREAFLQALRAAEAKPDDLKTSVAYWTAFHRRELMTYLAETASQSGEVKNFKDLAAGMRSRAEEALAKAAVPAEQAKLIAAAGVAYTVPNAAVTTTEPSRETVQTTAPDVDLTSAQKQGLPDKLLKDYNDARQQVLEANKGKKPEEIAAAMKPVLERYRGIVDLRARMPADHRKAFDSKIAATTTPGARDQLVTEYGKSFSPRKQLDVTIDDPNRIFDGNPRSNNLTVVATSTGPRTDGRSAAEIAEDQNRAERERQELSRASHRTQGPGNMIASGIAKDESSEPKPKDPNANRDIINGAKLGLWGVLVGAFLMGPLGAVLLGAVCVGLGTVMSKEMNK